MLPPFGPDTLTGPVLPFAVTAVIVVALTTVKDAAWTPPNETPQTPVKFVPVIVTVVPGGPVDGVNDVIVGGGTNVNPANDEDP